MVSVELLVARLLRLWIGEAAAVVTPAMSIDNSIAEGCLCLPVSL